MKYRSKKAQKKEMERRIKRYFFLFFIPGLLIFLGSIFFMNADFLQLKDIMVVGNKNTDSSVIEKQVLAAVEGRYGSLYNKNNFIIYPEKDVIENILQDVRIKEVEVEYDGIQGNIVVKVREKEPKYLYCVQNENCYFMESDGSVFSGFKQEETAKKKEDFFVFFERRSIPGTTFLDPEAFYKLVEFVDNLENQNLDIVSIEKGEGDRLVANVKSGTKIIFSAYQDFDKLIESLRKIIVKKDLRIEKEKRQFTENLVYLNMTHGESIFYCLGGSVCENNYLIEY